MVTGFKVVSEATRKADRLGMGRDEDEEQDEPPANNEEEGGGGGSVDGDGDGDGDDKDNGSENKSGSGGGGAERRVKIRTSGWFGVCFTYKDGADSTKPTRLLIETVDSLFVKHELPLRHDKRIVESLDFGILMHLRKGSVVVVHCDDTNQGLFEWGLFRQRYTEDVALLSGELMSSSAKRVACAHCRKQFKSVEAAEKHILDKHSMALPIDSLWNKPLEVVHLDEHMSVVVKPQGMPVMGSSGLTLMKSNLLTLKDTFRKAIPVHRIDAPTGGLLVVALDKKSERNLKISFADRACKKRYRALLFGKLGTIGDSFTVDEPINGKEAQSTCIVLKQLECIDPKAKGWVTLVDLLPLTGRKHQLRRHMRHLNHPIWGDKRYGFYPNGENKGNKSMSTKDKNDGDIHDDDEDEDDLTNHTSETDYAGQHLDALHQISIEQDPHARLCLWAMGLTLPHPATGKEIKVAMEDPQWLTSLMEHLSDQTKAAAGRPSNDGHGKTASTGDNAVQGWIELEPKNYSRLLYVNPVCFLCTVNRGSDGTNNNNNNNNDNSSNGGPVLSSTPRNVMVLSWLTATNNEGRFMFSLNRRRFTSTLLEVGSEFVLCVPVKGMEELVLRVGGKSGRWGSKFEADHRSDPLAPSEGPSKDTSESMSTKKDLIDDGTQQPLSKRQRKKRDKRNPWIRGLEAVEIRESDGLFAVNGTVCIMRCRAYSITTDPSVIDDEHSLVLAEVGAALVNSAYWDVQKNLFRAGNGHPPCLKFYGSQTFGYIT